MGRHREPKEEKGRLFDRVGEGRDQRDGARAIRMVERDRKGDRAAKGMTDNRRGAKFELADRFRERRRLRPNPRRASLGSGRISGAGPVEGDDTEFTTEALD